MDEKTMVSDALVGVNGELKMFGDMIPQTENKELKQCLKQIRNQCEMSQEKLYQVAREKSYYVPAAKATQQEVDHVKSILTQPKMDCRRKKYSGRRFLQPLYGFTYYFSVNFYSSVTSKAGSFESMSCLCKICINSSPVMVSFSYRYLASSCSFVSFSFKI